MKNSKEKYYLVRIDGVKVIITQSVLNEYIEAETPIKVLRKATEKERKLRNAK